jgi:hypothetical protein
MLNKQALMKSKKIKYAEITLISFVWVVLLVIPILFREDNNNPLWKSINTQLEILVPVSLLFILNRFVFVPFLLFRGKLGIYIFSVSVMILLFSMGSHYYDTRIKLPAGYKPPATNQRNPPPRPDQRQEKPPLPNQRQPRPAPPFANFIVLSVLMIGFDTGLRSGLRWIETENEKVSLEKENVATRLVLLQNKVSPHFFMNTLNNIYSLIDSDRDKSKAAVMKLSKLMRYLLYENQTEKVLLSKELDFIANYIGLMKIRYTDDIEITLKVPGSFTDVEIPFLLFIPYLENAFKYGTSYQNKSYIEVIFEIENDHLVFSCRNSKNVFSEKAGDSGTEFMNSRKRLDLLYKDRYSLLVTDTDDTFSVTLRIPLT